MENHEQIENMLFSENPEDRILGAIMAIKNCSSQKIQSLFDPGMRVGDWHTRNINGNDLTSNDLIYRVIVSKDKSKCFFIGNNTTSYMESSSEIKWYIEHSNITLWMEVD